MMLERGLSDETLAVLKSMMNPAIVSFLEARGIDLRKTIIDKLTPEITASLQRSVQEVSSLRADPQHCRVGEAAL